MTEELTAALDDFAPRWLSPGVSRTTPLVVAASAFVEHLGRSGASANTVAAFAADLRLFCRAAGCDQPVGELTRSQVEAFYADLLGGEDGRCSSRSLRRRATALQALFRFLAEEGAVDVALTEPVARPPEQAEVEPPLSEDEVASLLAAARQLSGEGDPRALFLALLVLGTGLSKRECIDLRAEDFDLTADTLTIHAVVRGASAEARPQGPKQEGTADDAEATSARRDRALPLSPEMKQAFLSFRERCPGDGRLFSCTGRNLEYVLARAGSRAGLSRNPSFRLLRATAVCRMLARGGDARHVVDTLGISPATWPAVRRRVGIRD
ncbi:MAG: tyrosine-type recombinase/integrase [Anaerolineae bacterium]